MDDTDWGQGEHRRGEALGLGLDGGRRVVGIGLEPGKKQETQESLWGEVKGRASSGRVVVINLAGCPQGQERGG